MARFIQGNRPARRLSLPFTPAVEFSADRPDPGQFSINKGDGGAFSVQGSLRRWDGPVLVGA